MEQTAFQQKLEELKRIKEQRRLETLRQKYSTAPDFSNMNLHDELKIRFDLDELSQLEQKFGSVMPKVQPEPQNDRLQTVVDNYNLPSELQNCHMEFDGKNLSLYKNGTQVNNLDAMSGHKDYQSGQYQNVKGYGPIPKGTYYANQNMRQNISLRDTLLGLVKRGAWPGSLPAWGNKRVWLEPDKNTNTYNRQGFTIHGGWSKGSAGCIDIPWQTDKLDNYLDNCQNSVPVYVKYYK